VGVPRGDENRVPGRPRSREADRAILEATVELLAEKGYLQTSVDQIADRAGVSKPTVYRRYADKADLVTAAITEHWSSQEPPDTGDVRKDLLTLLHQVRVRLGSNLGMPMVGVLLVEEPHNPELLARFRERFLFPRRRQFREVLRRGQVRGQVREDVDLDTMTDVLFGPYYARHLSGLLFDEDWEERLLAAIWPALAQPERVAANGPLAHRTDEEM